MIIVITYMVLITIAIFVADKIFKGNMQLSKELERKIGHIGFGTIALSAPFMFDQKWQFIAVVGYLMLWFGIIRTSTYFHGGLYDVIHLSSRPTIGDILFPLAVLLMWMGITESTLDTTYYLVSVLVISLADSMASFIGKVYPLGRYKIAKSVKSLSGSAAFLFVTMLIFVFFKDTLPFSGSKLILVAVLATMSEAFSGFGLDNITIPLVLYGCFHFL